MALSLPPCVHLNWQKQFRIIPSKFPPINFFEKIIDPDRMEEAFYLESLTNERLCSEVGNLYTVKKEDRILGAGASIVMAAFTHTGIPSRFTDGSFGVYYAAKELKTAIKETVYHRERFLRFTDEDPGEFDMRVYIGKVLKPFHDIRDVVYAQYHHPIYYEPSQKFASQLRATDSWGIVYNSVRHQSGECIAAFRPPAVSIPHQSKHLVYVWNGKSITSVYEKSELLFEFDQRHEEDTAV